MTSVALPGMSPLCALTSRRSFLGHAGLAALGLAAAPACAETIIKLPRQGARAIAADHYGFSAEGRDDPPAVAAAAAGNALRGFRQGRFHAERPVLRAVALGRVPNESTSTNFRLAVRGHVNQPLSLSLRTFWHCRASKSRRSTSVRAIRGAFAPPVAGGQWANGAMGNASWTGVRFKRRAGRAGVKAGASRCVSTGWTSRWSTGAETS